MFLTARAFNLVVLLLACAGLPLPAQTPAVVHTLVWSDEFDVDGRPDARNWGYEQGFVRNNELQWYQPDNAFCAGGRLVIEGRRERRPNPGYDPTSTDWKKRRANIEYTASSLITRGKHSWQYGRFEMRARIPTAAGLWPAFWTLGVAGEWPSCGEIDIMEYYRGQLLANAAWGTSARWTAKWDTATKRLTDFDADWANRFHVWRMDWDETSIRLFVDGLLLNTIELTKTVNAVPQWGPANPMRQPHSLLLNLAIGGDNGGDPALTTFPVRYEIDYVRVYRADPVVVSSVAPRMGNVSVRAFSRGAEMPVILGFVVDGSAPQKLLIRGVGPQLAAFGVGEALADPLLRLYRMEGGGRSTLLLSNDDWAQEGVSEMNAAFTATGAFALTGGSGRDAAWAGWLPPGAYTAQVADGAGRAGEGLLELYALPAAER